MIEETRSEVLTLTVTAREKEEIRLAALREDRSMSSFVRRAVLRALREGDEEDE